MLCIASMFAALFCLMFPFPWCLLDIISLDVLFCLMFARRWSHAPCSFVFLNLAGQCFTWRFVSLGNFVCFPASHLFRFWCCFNWCLVLPDICCPWCLLDVDLFARCVAAHCFTWRFVLPDICWALFYLMFAGRFVQVFRLRFFALNVCLMLFCWTFCVA